VAPTAKLSWTSLGPRPIAAGAPSQYNGVAPWSGRVTAIATHPTTAATAYVGGAMGGVWKTTDDGVTWKPIFDSQPSLAVGSIAIDPNTPSTLYVGTGESNFNPDSYFGAGLFKSTDGGANWSKVGGTTFDNCYVADVLVKPGASSTVFAAVHASGRYATACPSGIWRTTNGGTNWTQVSGGTADDLAFKPGTPNTIYAAYVDAGIWRSTTGGGAGSWSGPLAGGFPTSGVGRIALATSAASPARLYASVADVNTGGTLGTYRSDDSGSTWKTLPFANPCSYAETRGSGGQCSYDIALAAYPRDANLLYSAGIRLKRFNGTSWTTMGFGTTGAHVDIHALAFDANGRLWLGSDGGVWRKAGAYPWRSLNKGLALTQFEPGTSGSVAARFVGGTQDNGSMHRLASTGTWNEFNPGDGGYSAVDPDNADAVYSSYVFGTLYKSTDGGATNDCVFTATADYADFCATSTTDRSEFYAPVEMDPSDAGRLYVGTTRLWRTTTGGGSWSTASPIFPGTVTAIGLAKSSATTLYAAWRSSTATGVRRNTGTGWTAAAELPNRVITHIEVDPDTASTAYVALSGFGSGHVFRTTDSGTGWADLSGNLPDAPVNALAIDKRTTPPTIYAGTDVGVFWSVDNGVNWANAKEGLPNTVVMDVRLDTQANVVLAATHGRGLFSVPIASPKITTFSPNNGSPGSNVTITGENFTGTKSVKFGFTAGGFTVVSPTTIRATVPFGASTGKISVITGAGTAVSTGTYFVNG
jgi:hypothetical protein